MSPGWNPACFAGAISPTAVITESTDSIISPSVSILMPAVRPMGTTSVRFAAAAPIVSDRATAAAVSHAVILALNFCKGFTSHGYYATVGVKKQQ